MEYKEAVKKCREMVKTRTAYKWEIVKIALSVCIVKTGNNSGHRQYTLTNFAKDIGIAKGTLSRWKLEYENIVIKLPKTKREKLDTHALNQTMRKTSAGTSTQEVRRIYNSHMNYSSPEDKTLRVYCDRLRSMHFFICYGTDLKSLNKEDLDCMENYCKEMLKSIKTKKTMRAKKPVAALNRAKSKIAKG